MQQRISRNLNFKIDYWSLPIDDFLRNAEELESIAYDSLKIGTGRDANRLTMDQIKIFADVLSAHGIYDPMFKANNQTERLWYHGVDNDAPARAKNPFKVVKTARVEIAPEVPQEITPEYVATSIKLHKRKNKKYCYSYGMRFRTGNKKYDKMNCSLCSFDRGIVFLVPGAESHSIRITILLVLPLM